MSANGRSFLLRRVRARPPASAPGEPETPAFEWTLSRSATSIDEGEQITWTVSLDRNGVAQPPGQNVSIQIRTTTTEEFELLYPGETQAVFPDDFTQSFTSLISSLVASTPGMVSAVSVQGAGMILTFSSSWNGTFAFTRTTNFQAGEQGDKRSSFLIENASQGTILVAERSHVIVDTYVPPVVLTLTTLVIDTDYHLPSQAAGEDVGDVSGLDQNGDPISVDSLTLINDEGGRYTLVGNTLKTTAVAADFEGPPVAFYENRTLGIPFYNPTFQAQHGAQTPIQQAIRIRYQAPEINPAGGSGGSETSFTDTGAMRTAIASATTNRRIRIAASFKKSEVNGNLTTLMAASNLSLIGHESHIFLRDKCILVDSNGFVMKNLVMAAGADPSGGSADNRDSGEFRAARNGLVAYCTIRHSLDELLSVISGASPFCRNIRFYRTAFIDPLFDTQDTVNYVKHSEGAHAFGPISYNYMMNIVFDQCVFIGTRQRAPLLNKGRGLLVQNCFVAYDGSATSQFATCFNSSNSSKENNTNLTGIVRGNLYWPVPDGSAPRANAIVANRIGAGAYCYIPTSGPEMNHFINPVGPVLTDDPITSVTLRNSDAAAIVNYEPFVPFYSCLPTNSIANRQALYDILLGPTTCMVGARVGADDDDPQPGYTNMNKYDGRTFNKIITEGRIFRPRPEDLARDWGSDWLGGTDTVTGLPAAIGNMTDLYT